MMSEHHPLLWQLPQNSQQVSFMLCEINYVCGLTPSGSFDNWQLHTKANLSIQSQVSFFSLRQLNDHVTQRRVLYHYIWFCQSIPTPHFLFFCHPPELSHKAQVPVYTSTHIHNQFATKKHDKGAETKSRFFFSVFKSRTSPLLPRK